MSSFYNKYRPIRLSDLQGDRELIKSIKAMAAKQKQPSTILITGDSGTGKTTLARAYARALLGVDDLTKVSSYYEENVGAEGGVDKIRELLEIIRFKSADFRIFVLDEIHALSRQGFHALLKPLEEPPEDTLWILVTNKPQLLKPEIVNRAVKFNLTRPSPEMVKSVLSRIALKEKIKAKESILTAIATHANGDMREAISTLEAVSSFKEITKDTLRIAIKSNLGEASKVALNLVNHIYLNDAKSYLNLIINFRGDYGELLRSVINLNMELLAFVSESEPPKVPWITSLMSKAKGRDSTRITGTKILKVLAALKQVEDRIIDSRGYNQDVNSPKEWLCVALYTIIQ